MDKKQYYEGRKIGAFDCNIQSRTLLIKKIWELNDKVSEIGGEVRMLLDLTPGQDKKAMKKGLSSVAGALREMADKLEHEDIEITEIEVD